VSTVDEAFELREQNSDLLLAGEVNGYPIKGFDLPNSPSVIKNLDLTNQQLALRTTAGTQGVVLAQSATHLYVASLCVATATAESIRKLEPESITFVDTGVKSKGGGEEDIACSDYITSIIDESPLSISNVQNRVRVSRAASKFSGPGNADFPKSDLELSLKIDRFSFAMKVLREDNCLILRTADE
jgi:2-phosphosulfolactate phosphatase